MTCYRYGSHTELGPELREPGPHKLAWPVAILTGCGITAGTTYALVRWVQHLIATAVVSSDPNYWMEEARTKAYDACYLGCNDCNDPSWAYNACTMTAKAVVAGITCDGNQMWNWQDRYPVPCLQAVGEFYKTSALKSLKQSYRNRLAIIILTVLAGVLGAAFVLILWKRATVSLTWRDRETSGACPPPRSLVRKEEEIEEIGKSSNIPKSRGRLARHFAFFGGLAALVGKANAYSCTGYSSVVNQYFVNNDSTIFGVIHGWLSDCYDYQCACHDVCSGTGDSRSCNTYCSTCTGVDAKPSWYVNQIIPRVQGCGFNLVDKVEGDVSTRIANSLIERNFWVKVSVNTYNLTTVTDPLVLCLHAIG
ncbi:hypothetical protein TWF694_009261 [Orbilia ellipsospora]|uniref:Uncharacterized protein n=1 Tax=Orbilia ellipsospora TaxID=2528407 RepID=A0AAV9XEG1_9PEZI